MPRQSKRKRTVTQANVKKVKSNAVSNGGSRRSSRSIKRRQKEESSEEEEEEEDDDEEEEDSEEEESEDESEPVEEIKYVLTDAHRAFNQRLLAEAVMTYTKADELKAEVVEAFKKQTNDDSDSSDDDDDEEENSLANKSLDNMIEDTNSFLSKYQIQIKQSKYDGLGEEYIGFANNNNNGSTTEKILTKMYDEGTVKLLEELIDACIDSPTGTVSPDVAKEDFYSIRNRHPKLKERITIANCLHRLKEDKWIKLGSQDGLYRLGPRAFVELKDYLESKGAMKSRGQIYIADKSMLTRAPRA